MIIVKRDDRKDIEDIYHLSPMQEGMLYHSLYASESDVYFNQLTCTLQGKLNISAFKKAWQNIVDRHSILRTLFIWKGLDKPLQVVRRNVKLPFELKDWRSLSPSDQLLSFETLLDEDRRRGFDLSKAPLMRMTLINIGENNYKLVYSSHHLLLDGWSLPLILKEVFIFYEAFCQNQEVQMERPRPYRDYITWLKKQDLSKAEVFWRKTLKGFTAPTPLNLKSSTDNGPEDREEAYGEQHMQLPTAIAKSLQSLGRQHELTLNTLVQGAWAILLRQYSDGEDVVFGSTVSGRPPSLRGVESMVGLFINTLPLRVRVSPDHYVIPWLKNLQAKQVVTREYEYSPLVQIHGWSDVPRGLPLFESILVFENYPVDRTVQHGLNNLEVLDIRSYERTNYPITIGVSAGENFSLQIGYDRSRVGDNSISRMLGHFRTLLEGMALKPNRRISELPILTNEERRQILVEWNDTQRKHPTNRSIQEIFENQVNKTPDSVALAFREKQLSYKELNQRANQLAHYLTDHGVGPESRVGICLERSTDMIAGMLGILKAGGAYVPLDPTYPKERLDFMVQDSSPKVVLTQERFLKLLSDRAAHIVCIDTQRDEIDRKSKRNPKQTISPDNLAYVIYTSGSTGKPKGVLISHGAILGHCDTVKRYYDLESNDRILQFASFNFDASLEQIFPTLIVGARLVLRGDELWIPSEFLRKMEQFGLTVINLPSAYWQQLVREWAGSPALKTNIRPKLFVVGGDVMDPESLRLWHQTPFSSVRLLNAYGPTEATITATTYEIPINFDEKSSAARIPIGRPLYNRNIFILDKSRNPVPVEVNGELHLGGEALGRGYLNQPELTAERFIPNPFSEEPGERLYKTGDLARYLPDGNIEFLGRVDNQVKIRGFRIETGEIETTLREHPYVNDAVVAAREDGSGEKELIGYLVAHGEQESIVSELRGFLNEKLPGHMVPSYLVTLDELPLTPSGKIDRKALPEPDKTRPELGREFVAPRTPTEEILADIWAQVLGIEKVGVYDNFFELGGHSLLATQVVSRTRDAFKVELPLRNLIEEPTVSRLAETIDEAGKRGEGLKALPIIPIPRDGELPVSFAQERLWFLDQFEPGSSAYNMPGAVRVRGRLDVELLERSINEIIRRHGSLRTTFKSVDGKPKQVIASELSFALPVVDLRELPEEKRESRARTLAIEEAKTPFDLESGPLLRATVLRLGEEDHVGLFTMHHIISDGWSMGILIREVAAIYDAYSNGKPSPLPELPIQYADFSQWQRQWLQGEVLESQLQYWKQKLDGLPPVLELPTDRPRPAVQTYNGAHESFELSSVLSEALGELSRREGATLFMTLLGAFQTLLYRYTGQEDIAVGTPIANRNRSEIEGLIGFFVNTLVLRTDFSGNPSFLELLRRVKETSLEAYAYQDLPFERLVEELNPERDMSHSPLFQVMFVLQNVPTQALEIEGLTLSPLEPDSSRALFDLTLTVSDTDQGLMGSIEYNTDLFDDTTITLMIEHFRILVENIVKSPDQRITDLPILTEKERHKLLVEWNDTKSEYPTDKCVHQLFEDQVKKTPDATAVVFEDQKLSYKELNERANQLGHYLRDHGVEPECRVCVCLERSIEMIVGLLGILKAGGVYVPVDPSYPKQRLEFMLEDSKVKAILTQESLVEMLPTNGAQVVCIDTQWEGIAKNTKKNPVSGITPSNLAYVIYTSGSTGLPKGVAVQHRSVVNHNLDVSKRYDLKQDDRVLQFYSISFDGAVEEIFPTLLSGATLALRGEEILAPGTEFLDFVASNKINVVNLPTAYWHEWVKELPSTNGRFPDSLRLVVVGGDRVSPDRYETWSEVVDGRVRWIDTYGPTETTVISTMAEPDGISRLSIGQPIANTTTYILDKHMYPAPPGVPGELHIGGLGLARGYMNLPELTAEKFIPNPFSDDSGERLYKTGDLARYLPDGNIEFLGRIDHQVKIRGFRIETGEVESVLREHPYVKDAVVVARGDGSGDPSTSLRTDKHLVAYVVTAGENQTTDSELRNYLKQKLPEYMVPSSFVTLDELPLTPSGKVDRKALPEPDKTRPELGREFVAPRTPTEEILSDIWAQVLGIEKVGVYDNFFELGGHSLLATQVVSRTRDAFKVELPLRNLIEEPTVSRLAETIDEAGKRGEGLKALPIIPIPRDGELPVSFAQERLWFLDQFEPGSSAYNMPGAVRVRGRLDVELLERSINEIIRRHGSLRTTFKSVDGKPKQVIASELSFALPVVDLRELPEEKRESRARTLAIEEAKTPFDLESGPLLRATVLRLGEEDHVGLFTMHHIISDGWSMGILIREVAAIYDAYSNGKPSPLPELPIQYADFSQWQRQWLQGEVLESQLQYWKQKLDGLPPVLELPTDRPRPAVQTYNGAHESFELSSVLSEALGELSRREGATLFMTLLGAFQTLLYRYTGQEDIAVGTPIANRNRSEIEGLIGFFVNTLVLRTDFSGNPSFLELLRRVKETSLEAYAYQDLPFERLVEELNPERDMSHSPLFQVMFVLQNVPTQALEIEGLTLSPLEPDSSRALFDLTLTVSDTDQGLMGSIEYNTDLFDDTTITLMIEHFRILVENIVKSPDQRITDLPILTEKERHKLLVEWNDTKSEYPTDKCVHQLFEDQVKKTPDATAVVFEDQKLSYKELNERANQLGHYLRDHGVEPECRVCVCLERSIEMIVGLLGILKAGGVYVPVDPSYPKQRLEFMLEDSKVKAILTQESLVEMLPTNGAQVVCIDTQWEGIAKNTKKNPVSGITPSNLAYVIYTSGSTGKPKGVPIIHSSLVNFLCSMGEQPGLTSKDLMLAITTLSFDIAALEIFLPIIKGACVELVTREVASYGTQLLKKITDSGATVIQATPATWRMLLEVGWSNKDRPKILCGGEALSSDLADELVKRSDSLWNVYGPTETTIWSTIHRVSKRSAFVSIGRPIGNTQIYILDKHLTPVPIGVPGELHIGGAGLARGYLNSPELTVEKFIPNPFSDTPGERLYKTGDLARYLPDGNIEFLGRIDNQVKIRGFRIETGEIESILREHPAVRDAVVVARGDGSGDPSTSLRTDKQLIAYLIYQGGQEVIVSEVRGFLREKLPEYMVPSSFVTLDELPLTPSGKVDRKALPEPDKTRPELGREFVAPRTPTEEILSDIWAQVLGIEKVGVYDNFFELGGHSLLATQVVSRTRDAFKVELPLRNLIEKPTVARLAEIIDEEKKKGEELEGPPIKPIPRDIELPVSFAQERLWFLDQFDPGSSAYNMPVAVRVRGRLDVELLERSINEIIRRHGSLRTTFKSVDGKPVQVIAPELSFTLPVIDLSELPEEQRESRARTLAIEEFTKPFDLAKGALIRAKVLHMGEDEHVVLFTMHHIISDGWSMGILITEVAAIYDAYSRGEPSPLPELPIQYGDFSQWQRQWLQGEVLESQLGYWKQKLDGLPPVLELPTDRPRPAIQTYNGAHESFELSSVLSEALAELSRREGATLFMTLLAAFQTLLYRYTGQEDIAVGTPIANRNRSEIEGLIGFFVNTLVLRTDFSGNPSFLELLRRVKETSLEAYAHQDLPFEKLVEHLRPERDLSRTPLFQVFFNMLNVKLEQQNVKGLAIEDFPLSDMESKFDLTLYADEGQGRISFLFAYNRDLFNRDRIHCLTQQFLHLLNQIAKEPDKKLSTYSLVAPEHRDIIPDPSIIITEPDLEPVTSTFLRIAETLPNHIAVSQGNRNWTYAKLAWSSSIIARTLRSREFQKGDVVAIHGEKSIGLIASVIGVLLNGCVILTLDRQLPDDRKQLMLREAGVKGLVLVGSNDYEHRWSDKQVGIKVIRVDSWDGLPCDFDSSSLCERVQLPLIKSSDRAYIFFTSGSTGLPKGILGWHKGLSHFINWQHNAFNINSQDRVSQLISLSFDAVLRDIFLPLTSGATLCLPEESDDIAANDVLNWLDVQKVTVLHTVPSITQFWLTNRASERSLRYLRYVFFAGEPLTDSLVNDWKNSLHYDGKIVNLYGPTETTLVKSYYEVPQEVSPGIQPIGKAMPQTQVLILNTDYELCGIGEPGEIVIRTPFRTLGYINSPDEQLKRFRNNPFSKDENDVVYLTGDLGRYRPDGSLDILGRVDDQLKIRGVRVEPSEVTATLSQHPDVQACFVTEWKNENGERALVAYVVTSDKQDLRIDNIRKFLINRLPLAFVPSVFVTIDQLPLTANGKVDRQALPSPLVSKIEIKSDFVSPRNTTEKILVDIWIQVLGHNKVGIHDNFFDLGGHSLLATQIISRVREAFNVELPLRGLIEEPTISNMAKAIEEAKNVESETQAPPIKPIRREIELPVSFAQERLWFLDQFDPGSSAYNMPVAVRVRGRLDLKVLERSINEIIRRQGSLRTTFKSVDGKPKQVIASELSFALPVIDLRELPEEKRESRARTLAIEEAKTPFDLESGPLLRATVLRLGEEDHVGLFTMHHIISDGWSMGILIREVAAIYDAYSRGEPSPLPELPIQYGDFSQWQRQWLQGEVLESQLGYWKQKLDGLPPVLELPTDRPRPAIQTYNGAHESFELSSVLSEALAELSRREGATLFMTLLAAFQTLLYRYTGQEDIAVGTPIANRNRSEIEGLIGFFVNTLVLRTDFSGNPSFLELLRRVKETSLEAYAHQDLPFERLVEELNPERNMSHSPLFQVMFALQNTPMQSVDLGDLVISPVDMERETAKFDLTMFMVETDGRLMGSIEYNTNLFNDTTITRMIEHFRTLVENIVKSPDHRITELPILNEKERHQLLVEWNDTKREYPRERCVHELFEEQVEKTPNNIALVFEDQKLTYKELNERSNQLAYYLIELGVGRETLVGICMERSLEMIIGLLGILKAGGGYVPLDPSYPKKRLEFMIKDSQIDMLLTQTSLVETVQGDELTMTCLDEQWNDIATRSKRNPSSRVSTDNLAYVIYTSGSTGNPKGVGIAHSALHNLLLWQLSNLSSSLNAKTLQFSPVSFDVSFQEILSTLLGGGSLFPISENTRIDASELFNFIIERGIERIFLPVIALRQLSEVADGKISNTSLLREVITAGEQLNITPPIERMFSQLKDCILVNQYGPTESHVVTAFRLKEKPTSLNPLPPIGRPISNTRIYIMDKYLNPVPIGVAGELHVGGLGLSRGYLNRPALTAEKFIPDPFSEEPGQRLYKTGDLARYLPDGNIEFLGRIDNQVKIRGFRVEMGEIESVLREHPYVNDAVVVARGDGSGDPSTSLRTGKQLIAYLVAQGEKELIVSELRGFLKEKLPEYMVPSYFVTLDELPLTPSGKVDRRALPEPDKTRPELGREFVAPRTPTEQILADIWSQVLGIEKVGVYDNFFELGGHSLLATQVVSRTRDAFKVELPLRNLIEEPTVARLAETIDEAGKRGEGLKALPIIPIPRDIELPVSFAQERLWFLDQFDPGSSAYNMPVAVRVRGRLDLKVLERSINEIIRRHGSLRTRFKSVDGKPTQVIASEIIFTLPVLDLRDLPEDKRESRARRLAIEEAQKPFELESGPLLRATVLRLGEQDHVGLFTMHHIISDGWSMGILIREVAAIYDAYSRGKPSPLPELPIQYGDFAQWQRKWLQGEVLESQLEYWKQKLDGLPPVLELPTDRPRPAVQTYNGAHESFELSSVLSEALAELSRREGATLFMTLLAAFQTLLYRYTGQEDIAVGTPIANRNRSEIEGLIGFFVNTLVLRTDFSGNPGFLELLRRVKETSLEAYAHQDLPFERLVEELNPERNMSHSPLFQVMFVLQNTPMQSVDLGNLVISPVDMERETAKFDLTMFMVETDRGLTGSIEYNTNLFNDTTITRMIEHFRILVENIVKSPDHRITELPILTEKERHQLLVEWNDTKREYPRDKCVHELFEEQVEKNPDNIAVVFEDERLTYRELNERANQLAHYLLELGVGPEVLVGICMERSLEMIIGLLGILKAGGAYLPLDPDYPNVRLEFMMRDAIVNVLITQKSLLEKLRNSLSKKVCIDADWEEIDKKTQKNPEVQVSRDNLAYVIYTSGSTGNPKGVQIHHRSLTNFLISSCNQLRLTSGEIIPAINTYSFDISILEIFVPLVTGARVGLISHEIATDGSQLSKKINQLSATMIHATPATWKLLFAADWKSPKTFKLLSGGEELIRDLANQLIERSNSLWNVYGPTEATVYSTFYQVANQNGSVPIGRPIANTKIFILDKSYNPVSIGTAGELHIGGDGLSRGYLNRPDLTAEKFIPNPFSEEPGERLYKTGDLARYLPDSNIEFLGRIDNQVKIRGFRIETGEIESILRKHPYVNDAVVVAREDAPAEKRLVAYLLVDSEHKPVIEELRAFLMEKLPEYMVPSSFVTLDELPLTPSGKVDRKALPEPDKKRPEILQEKYVAPRNPIEQEFTDIWSEVLGVDQVGIYDNFFDLGGNSLQATRLIYKISSDLQYEVSVKTLFLNPTISDLVNAIAKPSAEVEDKRPSVSNETTSKELVNKDQASRSRLNDYIEIERRPLLDLIKDGEIKQLDAAAIGYLSSSILDHPSIDRKMVDDFFNNKPIISNIMDLDLGRIAIILIPFFESELYADQDSLVDMIIDSLELAGLTGAKTVSLTGLIPSATGYGRAIYDAVDGRTDLPQITTGHATTTSSVVLQITRALRESGRELSNEKVGFLGLGSIGMATLSLMLKSLPHPSEITLCDLYSKHDTLEKLKNSIIREFGYCGSIQIVGSGVRVPSEFYENSLIIGATNVPEVIDIKLAKPGTIIVDDSAPHCFSVEDAIRRFEKHVDIIFTEGGVLQSPKPVCHLRYLPEIAERLIEKGQLEAFAEQDSSQITGCVLSGLLSSRFDNLKPTLGLVEAATSCKHYEILKDLGFDAAELHCGNYVLEKEAVKAFRQNFSIQNTKIKKDIRIGIEKSPLVTIQPLGSKPPFYCVHAIGGSVFSYYDLSKFLGKDQPFYGLESVGMEGEEPPLSNIERMAALYIQAIQSVQSVGPYSIGGWSMGGLIAYEMAQQLLAQKDTVSQLILFDSHSLRRNRKATKRYSNRLLRNFLEKLCYYFKNPNTSLDHVIDDLPDEGWSEEIIYENELSKGNRVIRPYRELAKILGINSSELNLLLNHILEGDSGKPLIRIWNNLEPENETNRMIELRHAIRRLDIYLNNYRAMHKYKPKPYPGQLTLIRAKGHFSIFEIDKSLGWGTLAKGGVEVHIVPGDHYTIFKRPNVNLLAEKLNACLNDANGTGI